MATPSTGSTAQQAKDTAHDLADQATDKASDLADKAKDQAGDLVDQAKSAATDKLSAGKEQATGLLSDVSEALHATSDTLHDKNQDAFARYADVAARQVEDFTSAIRGRSVGELLDEAEGFARREPALFLGGAFLLGIFGSRFLKAGTGGPGGPSGGGSARSLLSGVTLPGGQGGHEHLTNVNRPPDTPYGRDLTQGHASTGTMAGGTARTGGLSGGHLPAGNPAAAGSGSMRTAVGTAGAGADAPVRSGTGATPMSTSPMSGSGTPGSGTTATGTTGSGRTGADPS